MDLSSVPTILSVDNAAQELIHIGILGLLSVVQGNLVITDVSRRNRNFRVTQTSGSNYFVKQALSHTNSAWITIYREAAFYSYCQFHDFRMRLAPVLPKLHFFDSVSCILVTLLVEYAESLSTAIRTDAHSFVDRAFFLLGSALAQVHNSFATPTANEEFELRDLPKTPPWVMHVHEPTPEMLAILSHSNYETIKILQTDAELCNSIDSGRQKWQSDTLIHGDIKLYNVLINKHAGQNDEVKIVDWELVQIRDRAWDIAGVLQDLVMHWVVSMQYSSNVSDMTNSANTTYRFMQRYARQLWRGYSKSVLLDGEKCSTLLLRSVHLSAIRLIQAAYERKYTSNAMAASSVLALQSSNNI